MKQTEGWALFLFPPSFYFSHSPLLPLFLTVLLLLNPLKKGPKTMLADSIVSTFIARSSWGSNSRREISAHSSVPILTRIRTNDLPLAISRYSARSIGQLMVLTDISAISSNPVKPSFPIFDFLVLKVFQTFKTQLKQFFFEFLFPPTCHYPISLCTHRSAQCICYLIK